MKITVITVCYNAKDTILDACESVVRQQGAEVEHIVVDGGSTDGTVEKIRAFAEKAKSEVEPRRSSFRWLSEKDRGMYDALNKGMKMATGDVIGILNADDVLAGDDVLERIARSLEGPIDGCYGDVRFVRESSRSPESKSNSGGSGLQAEGLGAVGEVERLRGLRTVRYCSGRWFRPWMFRFGTQTAHPSTFFRRECFAKWGDYSLDYGMYGDFELLCRFIWKNRARMEYLPICTTVMRMGGASTDGWRTTLNINRSDLRALKANGCWSCMPLLYSRYLVKIWGFVFKR